MNKLLLLSSMCAFTAASLWAQPSVEQHSAADASQLFSTQEVVSPAAQIAQAKASKSLVKTLSKDAKMIYTRNADGSVTKQIVKSLANQHVATVGDSQQAAKKKAAKKAASTTSDYTLYEGFEGYDGTTDDWIPTTWSRIVTNDSLKTYNGNCTWHVGGAQFYGASPAAGSYMAQLNSAIQYDDNYQLHAMAQDEWLISPQFSPKANEKLIFTAGYAPVFLFDLTNGVDWSTFSFTDQHVSATLKVMVQVDGGEWKQVFDVYDLYKDMTLNDLYDKYASTENFTHIVSLDDYVGKNIKVAFRYVGSDGNGMAVDEVKVGVPQPAALYNRPDGAYYFGFSDNYRYVSDSQGRSLMLVPAYAEQTWANYSNGESEKFTWTYANASGVSTTSNDKDLVTEYGVNYASAYNWYNVPKLTASAAGATDSTYQWDGLYLQAGGRAQYTGSDGVAVQYGVGNYEFGKGFYSLQSSSKGLYGYTSGLDAVWTKIFGDAKDHLRAIGNYFAEPEAPYQLSKVSVFGQGTFKDDALLKLSVIRVSSAGALKDTIATAECKGSEVITTTIQSSPYVSIPFNFVDSAGNSAPVVIDDAILVVLENFDNENTTKFAAYQSSIDQVFNETNGYFFMQRTDTAGNTTEQLFSLAALSTSQGYCYSSFLFNLHANFGWFQITDDVELNEDDEAVVSLPATSAKKTFNVLANDKASEWIAKFDTDDNKAPEWLSVTFADNKLSSDKIDGRGTITFSAADLPADVDERSATAEIGNAARGTAVFQIIQSKSSGVNAVSVSALKVANVGGDFAISAPADVKNVSLYTVAGQLVKTAAINGYTVVGASDLAHGAYLLHFSNGKTVKVIK